MAATYTTRTEEFGDIAFIVVAATATRAGVVQVETARGYASDCHQRRQICAGGGFFSAATPLLPLVSAITATEGTLKAEAQKWLRQRRDQARAYAAA
jgi:hypothetical protein